MSKRKYLLDTNVLVALTDQNHIHHKKAVEWFNTPGLDWGMCAFSEAGLLLASANPAIGRLTVDEASALVGELIRKPGYRFWPFTKCWAELVAPFADRVFGYKQITDAYLLGLAIKENGILVSFDKAMRSFVGPKFSGNVLILEP